jgi:hypothetical protein
MVLFRRHRQVVSPGSPGSGDFPLAGSAAAADPEAARAETCTRSLVCEASPSTGMPEVNNVTVWRAATQNLDELVEAVHALLADAGSPDSAT